MKYTNIPHRSKARYMNINVISILIKKNKSKRCESSFLDKTLAPGSWKILDLSRKFNYLFILYLPQVDN